MAQAFATTYQKYHREHKIERRKSLKPVDRLSEELPHGDIWLISKSVEEGVGLAAAQKAIDEMIRSRLWTIYQVDYCKDMIPKKKAELPKGNAILLYGDALYGPRTLKISPPLSSSRRIYGYIRPSRMYIPLSTFQTVYGKLGYDILKTNSELAKLRSS